MEPEESLAARRSLLREAETLLHGLQIYGSAGIAAFGWAVCQELGWAAAPWWPLWFCAALLIYNADRLHPDPADACNVPRRVAAGARWRGLSRVVLGAAAFFLVAWPLLNRDWLTLGLVLAGALGCLNYSIPLLGFRWKDVPLLKTFFAPTIVMAAILGLPWLHAAPAAAPLAGIVTTAAWSFLLFNMLLCDLRDLAGDRAVGIQSLPVVLGEKRTRGLLIALLALIEIFTIAAMWLGPEVDGGAWRVAAFGTPLYLGGLILAVRIPRSERFYEWAVEGMLFLPALAVLAGRRWSG